MTIFSKTVGDLLFSSKRKRIQGEMKAFVNTFETYAKRYTQDPVDKANPWPTFNLRSINNGINGCFAISAFQVLFRCQRFMSLIMSNFVDLHLIEQDEVRRALFDDEQTSNIKNREQQYRRLFETYDILEVRSDGADNDAVKFVSYCKWLAFALIYREPMDGYREQSMSTKTNYAVQELTLLVDRILGKSTKYVKSNDRSKTDDEDTPNYGLNQSDPVDLLPDIIEAAGRHLSLFKVIECGSVGVDDPNVVAIELSTLLQNNALNDIDTPDIVIVSLPNKNQGQIDVIAQGITVNDELNSSIKMRLIGAWMHGNNHYIPAIVDRITDHKTPKWARVDSLNTEPLFGANTLFDVIPVNYTVTAVIYECYD